MTLSKPQRGVTVGASSALALTLATLAVAVLLVSDGPVPESPAARARLFAVCVLGPTLMLALSVGRLANHRFNTPEDIAGSGLTVGTDQAKLLQALLQNTLEQLCLALPVYAAWALMAPPRLMVALPAAATLFVVGRVLFFWGYAKGAPGRAMGFGLTFYPTFLMLAGCGYFVAALVGT